MTREQGRQKEAYFETLPEWVKDAYHNDNLVHQVVCQWRMDVFSDEQLMERLAFHLFRKAKTYEDMALKMALLNPQIMEIPSTEK